MGRVKQQFIAETMGTEFTLYSVMKKMGIPLSEEQESFQQYLEVHYPPVVEVEEEKKAEGEANGMES